MVEEIENRNHAVIQKVVDEAFAVSHDLVTCEAELAINSYAPPGSRVMSEDEVHE